MLNNSSLHQAIISSFLEAQRPPRIEELSSKFSCSADEVREGLRALAEYHGVVLHPKTDEVWIAHPFSSSPTACVVHAGSRKWWGNCAWCSLGVAHLTGGDAEIETRIGGIDEAVKIRIQNGAVIDTDFVVHFPIPMQKAWDNVVYTCSVMLMFRSTAQVKAWCAQRGVPIGDVRPIEQVWAFASEWYSRHADPGWVKWSIPEAAEIFKRHGLTGHIWALPEQAGRF
jgi:hypothetical protein